jgi:hypothetical protein
MFFTTTTSSTFSGGATQRRLTIPPPGVLLQKLECVEMDIDECHAISPDSKGTTSNCLSMQDASRLSRYKPLTWTKMQVHSVIAAAPHSGNSHRH